MKRFAIFLVALTAVMTSWAVPAKVTWMKVALEEGDSIMVCLRGDESFHFLCTEDGTPVVKVNEGAYRLAPELKEEYAEEWSVRVGRKNAGRRTRREEAAQARRRLGSSATTGKKKGIVILVDFVDLKMNAEHTSDVFKAQFNEIGYKKDNHYGSVHDYFYDQSYGLLDLEFDVFGPVTLSRSYSFYGQNDSQGYDKYPGVMIAEACKQINRNYSVNWKDYDWDGDGEVDQVFCIYAGYGENITGADSNLLWPHECTLVEEKESGDGNGKLLLGGASIDTYAISCELSGKSGNKLNAIGTACHEFSHCLGLPDMYPTNHSGGFGMNAWDLMDCGSYNGPSGHGEVPSGFTAYERWYCGWLEPEVLDEPCRVTDMPALQDEPRAYIIYNKGYNREYFMLENRQPKGWFEYVDTYTNMHGMLVTHIDYNSIIWKENAVNDSKNHQRITVIPADKHYGYYLNSRYSPTSAQFAGDLFPGSKNVTRLDNTSHKDYGGMLFNKNTDGSQYMNRVIYDIKEENGRISFEFTTQELADDIRDASEEEHAEYFTLGGTRVKEPNGRGVYVVRKGDKVLKKLIHR